MKLPGAGHICALFTVFVWGITFVATKILMRNFMPIEILLFRFAVGGAALVAISRQRVRTSGLREEALFAAAGLTGIAVYYMFESLAIDISPVSNVGIITSAAPMLTVLVSRLFGEREPIPTTFYVGLACATCGLVITALSGASSLEVNPLGDALAFGATLAWAFYSNIMRKISLLGHDNTAATKRVFAWGLFFLAVSAPMLGARLDLARFTDPYSLASMVFLGLVASAACFVTWNLAIKMLGTVRSATYLYGIPVINAIAAVIVLGEHLSAMQMVGGTMAIAGLVISQRGMRA